VLLFFTNRNNVLFSFAGERWIDVPLVRWIDVPHVMQSKFNKQTNKLHRGENLNKMLEIIKVWDTQRQTRHVLLLDGNFNWGFSLFLALVPVQTMPIKEILFIPVPNPTILH
jgi:hypothetical protein